MAKHGHGTAQARFNHIASRGNRALKTQPAKRTVQQRKDVQLMNKTFGSKAVRDKPSFPRKRKK